MRFTDRIALVTGGASGLGRAASRALAAEGARVVVVDLDAAGAHETAEEVGGLAFAGDVSGLEANLAAVAFAQEQCGGIDLALLNAGVATGCGVGEDFDLELYRRANGVNLDGVVFGVHALLPALRARGAGSIVATASLAGLTGVPYDPIYAANKHGVVGLVRSLGPALALEGIRVNGVCPGFAESRIIDPIREGLAESGLPIIPAQAVAEAMLALLGGDMSGECWYIQPGRPAEAFRFRGIPGPVS